MNYFSLLCILLYPLLKTTPGFCGGQWSYTIKFAHFSFSLAAVSVAEIQRHLPDIE